MTLVGTSPYSQSYKHDQPKLEKESNDAHERRTWRSKMTVIDLGGGKKSVAIPAHGLHQAIAAAAKYSKRQIPEQGKATWTAKFTAGIMIPANPPLNIDPETVPSVAINANSDGVRGSGKRVTRLFPEMSSWRAIVEVYVLDSIITKDVFTEMVEIAGKFIGIGRFRPEKGGINGRFRLEKLVWENDERLAA